MGSMSFRFGDDPLAPFAEDGPLAGFDPSEISEEDYASERARALIEAIGMFVEDGEAEIGVVWDGRWAAVGDRAWGSKFAVEDAPLPARARLARIDITAVDVRCPWCGARVEPEEGDLRLIDVAAGDIWDCEFCWKPFRIPARITGVRL